MSTWVPWSNEGSTRSGPRICCSPRRWAGGSAAATGRYVWDRAADDVGWPRSEDGTWRWTFHSLRHVFATWAPHDARIPIEDVSRLMGHSSTRVTQDIYVHVLPDLYDRFFKATG